MRITASQGHNLPRNSATSRARPDPKALRHRGGRPGVRDGDGSPRPEHRRRRRQEGDGQHQNCEVHVQPLRRRCRRAPSAAALAASTAGAGGFVDHVAGILADHVDRHDDEEAWDLREDRGVHHPAPASRGRGSRCTDAPDAVGVRRDLRPDWTGAARMMAPRLLLTRLPGANLGPGTVSARSRMATTVQTALRVDRRAVTPDARPLTWPGHRSAS